MRASGRFLTAQWLDLLMLNFAVRLELLAPHVPAGTELGLWEGEALVSVVGFRFVDTWLLGVPGPPSALEAGSEAEFITEHDWGYTRQRDGGTVEYEVAHPPWRVWPARDPALSGAIAATDGPAFSPALTASPRSAFVAEGSGVTVYRPRRLARAELHPGHRLTAGGIA